MALPLGCVALDGAQLPLRIVMMALRQRLKALSSLVMALIEFQLALDELDEAPS
jgi:hypothetical protein